MKPHLCAALLIATLGGPALAQSFCASDGQPAPRALLERFINADCAGCWSDTAAPVAGAGTVALDWIVPGTQGEDAPLSAAAVRDAAYRLQALRMATPPSSQALTNKVAGARRLRVSRGLPLAGYMGVSIEMKPQTGFKGHWTAYVAMVETIPAGSEATVVERNLVRNVLQLDWDGARPASKTLPRRFYESRPMSFPAGANPDRISLVGWVQDEKGRIVAAAGSRCPDGFGK